MLCPSGCNIRRLLDHSGGGFRDLIIIQINLRACKEVAFSQTEQKPRIHLNAAVTVFAGVFSARIVFVGAISDAIEVLNRIFVGEGTEDTETVTFEEKLRLGHQVQTAFKHQGNRHRDDRTPLGSIAGIHPECH